MRGSMKLFWVLFLCALATPALAQEGAAPATHDTAAGAAAPHATDVAER